MKRLFLGCSLVALVTVGTLLLAGCGVPQKDYDAAVAQSNGLAADKASLQSQVSSLTSEKAALESTRTDLQSQVAALTADKTSLQTDKTNLETDKAALTADKAELQADKDQLTADLADLQDQYDAAAADLAEVNAVFPPRQFNTLTALKVWLAGNTVSELAPTLYYNDWYARGLGLQLDALREGYIVSVDYDTLNDGSIDVWCSTVINGTIYYWDPESDIVYEETGLTGIDNPTV